MITCPNGGLNQPEGAKFCERCGQGLTATAAAPRPLSTRPSPLAAGAIVRGYEILELLSQDSIENRYRAVRKSEGKEEKVTLRERLAPLREDAPEEPVVESKPEAPAPPPPAVDPHAKPAELKLPGASPNGEAAPAVSAAPAPSSEAEPKVTSSGSSVDAGVEVAPDSPSETTDASVDADA